MSQFSKRWEGELRQVDSYRWEIPVSYQEGMNVPGLIFANDELIRHIRKDQAPAQVANTATLPGVVGRAMAMPDIHWGYGFPIGGVVASTMADGIISPGGVGYDINCGVRMLRTELHEKDIRQKQRQLVDTLFRNVPCGVGSKGRIKLSPKDLEQVMIKGGQWAVENGYGWNSDLEFSEENGCLKGADKSIPSERARKRGAPQLGSLGSGNHFLEVQIVDKIFDPQAASVMQLFEGQAVVMIHCGSRGFGHQICTDFLHVMEEAMDRYDLHLPDRQLACAPLQSDVAQEYLAAMACAANYGWANRQMIVHWTRESFEQVFKTSAKSLQMHQIYDVAHNIAKREQHQCIYCRSKQPVDVMVHRKGATRAFGPGNPHIPQAYQTIGQPVLIPGDMGTASYILVGTQQAMNETFGSTCHGAGRVLSRRKAIKLTKGRSIPQELEKKGILVRYEGRDTVREETPEAYKDVNQVVDVVHGAGISKKVARMRPICVVKG
ncbi:MAG: RtcB family protein [Gemmatimonadetes bacterium]|nr:MAG: RtcB family protein [Gemmatimonadota bacterium]